ncbi:beta-galactosidase [Streptomyces sp. CRN 30]|uniref:beta-galactosidase n=1 Tax=Streptomyces sp. CRN 30 TaxID=3075613 RepID=UPI002A84109B|nr:beta-galactosidase [Streptomyces sp. CRN 30]
MGSREDAPHPLEADSRKLQRGTEPWLPVMGEFHFSRYPAAEWREELLKVRAGGIDLLATYLFWNQHEEERGTLRFDGGLDIRRFTELCGELGLYISVRIGPWSHGECRNGGFPDWLQQAGCTPRTDDPAYLALVESYYTRISHELRGLGYDDGGPIVAVQVENELYDQPGHLRTLRALAERAGIRAPLWTATGWGAADIPVDVLLPLYGGYPEAFWEDAHEGWTREMRRHYFFTAIRDDHAIGADLRPSAPAGTGPDDRRYPYATCELGGGMAIAYHRRPLVPAADVSSLALTKLGSGSVWQGYYLYHGCSQRLGHAVPNQESHDTGYPNDLPAVNYDFQAPLGEYGQVRPSFHALRLQHLLIRDSGADLADMPLHLPDDEPAGLDDRESLRWSVRANGETGFLFVNNHQPHETLPDHDGVRFQVHLGGRTATLPAQDVTVPSGAHFVWPLGYGIGRGVRLEWASAQPVTRLELDGDPVAVFAATAGITPQFALPAGCEVSGPVRRDADDSDLVVVSVPEPGSPTLWTVTGPQGAGPVHLLVLSEEQALRAQRVSIGGTDRLVLCAEPVLTDGSELRIHTTRGEVDLSVLLPPGDTAATRLLAGPGASAPRTDGPFTRWALTIGTGTDSPPRCEVACVRAEAVVPPARTGGSHHRASAPRDADFDGAAVYRITVPVSAFDDPDGEVLLRLSYTGDVARAYLDGRLVADHFWYGPDWEIGLRRFTDGAAEAVEVAEAASHEIEIRVLPLPQDSEVYVDASVRAGLEAARERASVNSAALVPVRRIALAVAAGGGTD